MLLAGGPQLRGGGRAIGAGENLDVGPGLLLSGPGLGQRVAGAFGLAERPGGLGGAGSGGELAVQLVDARLGRGQLVAGAQSLGAPALAVGQALRVALAVLGLIELGAADADLSLASAGRRGGGLGQPGDPGGIGQRVRVARRRGGVGGGRVRVAGARRGQRRWTRPAERWDVSGSPGGAAAEPTTWATRAASSLTASSDSSTARAVVRRRSASQSTAEPDGAEQLLQQPALAVGGVQELRELALGQQHDLVELLGRHAHEVLDLVIGLARAGGDGSPRAAVRLLEQDLGLLGGGPAAPPLRALLLGLAGDAYPAAAHGRLELDLGRRAGRRVIRAQPPGLAPLAGDPAVQGEPDRVQQRGLARAGLAVQQEQARAGQVVEAHLDGAAERTERGHTQPCGRISLPPSACGRPRTRR